MRKLIPLAALLLFLPSCEKQAAPTQSVQTTRVLEPTEENLRHLLRLQAMLNPENPKEAAWFAVNLIHPTRDALESKYGEDKVGRWMKEEIEKANPPQ